MLTLFVFRWPTSGCSNSSQFTNLQLQCHVIRTFSFAISESDQFTPSISQAPGIENLSMGPK